MGHMTPHGQQSIPQNDPAARSFALLVAKLAEEAYNLGLLSENKGIKQTIHLDGGDALIISLAYLSRAQNDAQARQNALHLVDHPEQARIAPIYQQDDKRILEN